jgi:hypothetical protein
MVVRVALLAVNALVFVYLLKLVASRGKRMQISAEIPPVE